MTVRQIVADYSYLEDTANELKQKYYDIENTDSKNFKAMNEAYEKFLTALKNFTDFADQEIELIK